MRRLSFLLVSILLLPFFQGNAQNSLQERLQLSLDSIFNSNQKSTGILVHVEAPGLNLSWSGAAGFSERQTGVPLKANQPILIASSIKTYVAATILELMEQGELSIEDPISDLLSAKTRELLTADGYLLEEIKVKHLMSHTSGVYNYANLDYIEHKNENKQYRWTRDAQLQLTVDKGDPNYKIGKRFEYSDANYLLLTEIIEGITKKPFFEAMRELLNYEALSLNDTWFPTLEDKPENTEALAHQYWTEYNWDSYDLDPSWDLYGGGGIACTTSDMARFIHAYFNGEIVENPEVRNAIFTYIETPQTKDHRYFLGLSEDSYLGFDCYGHGGFWGTVMLHFPDLNVSISVAVLERNEGIIQRSVIQNVMDLILREGNINQKMADLTPELTQIEWSPDSSLYLEAYRMPLKYALPGQGSDHMAHFILKKKTGEIVKEIPHGPANDILHREYHGAGWDLDKNQITLAPARIFEWIDEDNIDLEDIRKKIDYRLGNADWEFYDLPTKYKDRFYAVGEFMGDPEYDVTLDFAALIKLKDGRVSLIILEAFNYVSFPDLHFPFPDRDLSEIGRFRAARPGETIWSNWDESLGDEGRVRFEDLPENKKIKLPHDALFLHVGEGCGGGYVFFQEGWKWWQQE